MSIICPSCGSTLNQITNSHVRSKHLEFGSVTEFKKFFNLESLWSPKVTEDFIQQKIGKQRGSYNLTEKYYEGVKRAAEKRTGSQHWNYGNHWNEEQLEKISIGVKSSEKFQKAIKKWEDEEYRKWRLEIVNTVSIPNQLRTRSDRGLITAFEDKNEWDQYRSLVNRHTRKSLILFRQIIDPENLLEDSNYDLDHQFSKFEGFKCNISPEIIGSPVNLVPLDRIKNRQKRTKCSISKEELLIRYSNFISCIEPSKLFESWKP
jgi:hypothetical protein